MKLFKKIKANNEREISFLNLPLVQYGQKESGHIKEEYISILPKSLEHKKLDLILKFLPNEHDHIWIVRTVGLGEAQLLNFMMPELTEKWNAKNPCFISHRKIYKEMFEMYSNIPFYFLDLQHNEYAPFLKNRNIKYKGKYFHIHHCTIEESLIWLKEHQQGTVTHATEAYKKWSGITEFTHTCPNFSEEIVKSTIDAVSGLNLDKFVFLSPEANGTDKLPESFWSGIATCLEQKGYDIFVNTADGKSVYGKSVYLNIAQATYLASMAKKIISLRCGFAEVLAAIKERNELHVLYPSFRNISNINFLKTYSLKQYPFCNTDSILEYLVDEYNINEKIKEITKEI